MSSVLWVSYCRSEFSKLMRLIFVLVCLLFHLIDIYTDITMIPFKPMSNGQSQFVIRKTLLRKIALSQ